MSALICGSIAYDTIMLFQDRFGNHILPDKVHILNVSFHVPEMRREFGGCATNIAYNLNLLGGKVLPMATVGGDFQPYAEWLDRHGIGRDCIREVDATFTAQAFITTDMDDNQITAFHPGAMNSSHQNRVTDAAGVTIGMVSPDGRQGMIDHAQQFVDAGIPFVFDPGQAMPLFDGDDFKTFIEQATWVCVNDYESQLLQDRTGWSPHEIADKVDALIVTRGGKGSCIYHDGKRIDIPTAPVNAVVDPTGCGDAFRAGLLYGLMNDVDWEVTGRMGALMGAIKVEQRGTQNHTFTLDQFRDRYQAAFNEALTVL